MDEAIAWFRAFLDTEWTAKTAYHLEDDLGTFLAAKSAYDALKHKKAGEHLNRWDPPDDDMKKSFESKGKRVLFAVRPVTGDGEDAWAFYTSDHMNLDVGRAMDVLLVVQWVGAGFRLQSQYEGCLACDATGAVEGHSCEDCGGEGFTYWKGINLGTLSPAGETRKFEAPTHPRSLPAYQALVAESDKGGLAQGSVDTEHPLAGGGWWSAEHEGLDQRKNIAYFIITRSDGLRFFVEVAVVDPQHISPEGFHEEIQGELSQLAEAGVSNTTHAGTFSTRTRLQNEGLTVASLEKKYAGIFDEIPEVNDTNAQKGDQP